METQKSDYFTIFCLAQGAVLGGIATASGMLFLGFIATH